MKLDATKLTDEQTLTTSDVSYEMKITEKNIPLMFKLIVERLYRNKLGSMIREITSNAHDAHVEAGVDEPVVVELKKDISGNYISFIDKGVGMSPQRVERVYCELGESTKRDNDDEIGGYGIGGKTPLAYTKSFFIITRFDGIEYTYTVRMDSYSPKVELMSQISTNEHNGTEVKVPIVESDINTAHYEVNKQLYYFENIVFKGFNEDVKNDYKIYKGKSFVYRGDDYSSATHVCLGKVAYPIDFSALELNESDYRLPVGIKLNIGEVKVIPSREDLEYDNDTKKLIIKKLEEVKEELKSLLSKQYSKVKTLNEYYNATENFGKLYLPNDGEIYIGNVISKSDVDYSKFKYSAFKLPTKGKLLKLMYDHRRYGKTEPKRYSYRDKFDKYDRSWEGFVSINNCFYVKDKFNRKVIKQSYLNTTYGRFYVFTPKELDGADLNLMLLGLNILKEKVKANWNDDAEYDILIPKRTAMPLLKSLRKEFIKMVQANSESYDDFVVPQDYIDSRKTNRLAGNILKVGIPMKSARYTGQAERVTLETIKNFKGRIFYGFKDDEYELSNAESLTSNIVDSKYVGTVNKWNGFPNKGIVFVQISQSNEKYMKMLGRKVQPIRNFYNIIVNRNIDKIINSRYTEKINTQYSNEVSDVFKTDGFELIDSDIKDKVDIIQEFIRDNNGNNTHRISESKFETLTGVNLSDIKVDGFKYKKELDDLVQITEKSKRYLGWINVPYKITKENNELITLVGLAINK